MVAILGLGSGAKERAADDRLSLIFGQLGPGAADEHIPTAPHGTSKPARAAEASPRGAFQVVPVQVAGVVIQQV